MFSKMDSPAKKIPGKEVAIVIICSDLSARNALLSTKFMVTSCLTFYSNVFLYRRAGFTYLKHCLIHDKPLASLSTSQGGILPWMAIVLNRVKYIC